MATSANSTQSETERYRALAREIRIHALRMVWKAKSSHVGGALSMADILAVLYGGWLRVDPSQPEWAQRDRFILSKGHACSSLYAVLALRGFFPLEWLDGFYQDGGRLAGHATHKGVPGMEFSTGSLGHGLPVACGMAITAKRDGVTHRVVALLSDGECDEGSVWEAALFAPHHRLDNLIVVVDYNKIQSLGSVKQVLDLHPFREKWESFGWAVREVDGHNVSELATAFQQVPFSEGKPSCIIAHTIKGKGVSYMENQLLWHYRNPNEAELKKAIDEIAATA